MKRAVSAKGRDAKPMLLTICFLLGIANFYMHKAVAESGHPIVEETKRYVGRHFGPYGSYAIELALLIGAMWLAHAGSLWVLLLYAAYTAINGVATWLLLSNKA
jgi:hypothetical protein